MVGSLMAIFPSPMAAGKILFSPGLSRGQNEASLVAMTDGEDQSYARSIYSFIGPR